MPFAVAPQQVVYYRWRKFGVAADANDFPDSGSRLSTVYAARRTTYLLLRVHPLGVDHRRDDSGLVSADTPLDAVRRQLFRRTDARRRPAAHAAARLDRRAVG